MANYQGGIKTKENVISACKELFYKKGYKETTIADISELSGVNQGSIYYHFNSSHRNIKKTLGMIIYKDALKKMLQGGN